MGPPADARPLVITDEDVPDPMGEFLAARGYTLQLARERYGITTPDPVIARDASEARAVVYTFNRRHFLALAKRREADGSLSHPGMTVVSFRLAHPRGLPRLRMLMDDIEAVYQTRVIGRGVRMIAVVTETVLRFEDPESQSLQPRRPPPR
jgi:hypothetical protein